MTLDLTIIREQFPALSRPAIFLDNPAGTQVPHSVLERMSNYLVECNANHGGAFTTSIISDALLHEAHAAMADLLGAARAEEIVFGQNMTSLTLHISRSIARTCRTAFRGLTHVCGLTPPWPRPARRYRRLRLPALEPVRS